MSDNKKDDYGYFGTGIDGYVHYKQTFDQSFHEGNGVTSEPAKQAPSRHTERQDKETSKKNEKHPHHLHMKKKIYFYDG